MNKILTTGFGLLFSLSFGGAYAAETAAVTAVLNAAYGAPAKDSPCRFFQFEEQDYCVTVDSLQTVNQSGKPLTYILTTGHLYDKETKEEGGAHAATGIIGGFVLDSSQTPASVLMATPILDYYGSYGRAPEGWKLTQIGKDYWGWTNTSGYTAQGYTTGVLYVLAPKDSSLQELAAIPNLMSDEGACEKKCTSLEAELRFSAQEGSPVYPIVAKIQGEQAGKSITLTPKPLVFDATEWKYAIPSTWPITGY